MRDAIQLGIAPKEEASANLATHESKVQAFAYLEQLQRTFPDVRFSVNRSNYGTYTVEAVFDDEDVAAATLATMAACGLSYWDAIALQTLAQKGFPAR